MIGRFLYSLTYQTPSNIVEMDYRMAEIWKITNKALGTEDKVMMFWWIAERITALSKHAIWVSGSIGESQ